MLLIVGTCSMRRMIFGSACMNWSLGKFRMKRHFSVAIVGSGPSGFYTARALLREPQLVSCIDIFEKLPFPYGLVRYGVAPDHPEVKNCIHQFEKVTEGENKFHFFGNVLVGKDISVKEIRSLYDVVVLAFGAQRDRTLSLISLGSKTSQPANVFTAQEFVNWYNGYPNSNSSDSSLRRTPDLNCGKNCVIIGMGNVALDVARMLLLPPEHLQKTDIAQRALTALSHGKNSIQSVTIVGRRGPLQTSFTIAELRELINAPGSLPKFDPRDFSELSQLEKLERPRRRLTELLVKTALEPPGKAPQDAAKDWTLKFFLSPYQLLETENGCVSGVIFRKMRLGPGGSAKLDLPEELVTLPADLVVTCLGSESVPIDPQVPFDRSRKIVKNSHGKVANVEGLYAVGWCAYGVDGELAHTLQCARALAKNIFADLRARKSATTQTVCPSTQILEKLANRKVQVVTWDNWEVLNRIEEERGKKLDKCREKITDVSEALALTCT